MRKNLESASVPFVPERPFADRLAYSYPEAAELIGCSPRTVWTLVNEGRLRAVRINRLVRIPRSEIERFLTASIEG